MHDDQDQKTIGIAFQPLGRKGQFPPNITLLEAARRLGVGLSAVCGGVGVCGTCRVIVPPESRAALTPLTATEIERLTATEQADGMRLACEAKALADLHILIPPESLTASQRTQVEGRQVSIAPQPAVTAHDLRVEPAHLADLRADAARLRAALGQPVDFDLPVLRSASVNLRAWNWQARAALRGETVVALLPPASPLLGLAVDLGTTKLAGYLVDLQNGVTLAAAGAMNPQLAYGEDVMARISYALQETGGADRLQQAAAGGINQLIGELCVQADVRPEMVVDAVVVGNTAMHHLFLGLSTAPLGLAPYVAVESDPLTVHARDVGLDLAPGATVHLLPNIAGFIGADHIAALLATRMDETSEATLLLDIGTNTEICLAANGRLLSCSTASGPAFEGAHIRFGMRAAPGAIERVRLIDGQVFWETIEDRPPVGICGSGILDAVAQLRHAGVLNARGGMAAAAQVRQGEQGAEFVLVSAEDSALGREITISRKDIGEIQLAKAAMATGWQVLLERAGLHPQDVARVYVAGAFGNYIDVAQATAIGMLPNVPLDRFEQVGNVAGTGARLALVSRAERERAASLARRVEYVELTTQPDFQARFAGELRL